MEAFSQPLDGFKKEEFDPLIRKENEAKETYPIIYFNTGNQNPILINRKHTYRHETPS